MGKSFKERIRAMNEMYKLPVHDVPTLNGCPAGRITKFIKTIKNEVSEGHDINIASFDMNFDSERDQIEVLVMLADWFGDMIVYCRSEAMKYGIPLEEVLDIIMDSNESKLDENGNPIYDENGKFLKGANYWKPEPKIRELLLKHLNKEKAT